MPTNVSDTPSSQKDTDEKAIPSHSALQISGTTLSLTLDFIALPSSFWTGEEFIPYRASLLSTLPLYFAPPHSITRLLISISFPHHRTQSNAVRLTQRDLVNRIAALIRNFEGEVEVLFSSPETEWSQVRCLAPFWGLKGHKWKCKVEGRVVMGGSELGRKLLAEWRRMREGRELY
ncbi:hypothetical protein N431DRAFT_450082 [Stipitochalara longipes BDJ]|nr:hypothetical protein N431DRAFT_450082 [Stipitochalara longipes BDJ]